jgi:hypothetical protein
MDRTQPLAAVRQLVIETFRGHGVQGPEDIVEKILIRDGFYCGRSFQCDGFRAIWFIEERTVKFYRPDGSFLAACSPEATTPELVRQVA